MFVQVIIGDVADGRALRRQLDRWMEELRPGAAGWLGSTGGITPKGEAVLAVRFASEEDARRNSDRPEQGEWWAATEPCFAAPPTFRDSSDVQVFRDGGDDAAGFVQAMAARVTNRAGFEELDRAMEDVVTEYRPDLLGGYTAWFGDEMFAVNYFTSESEARAGERKELPDDLAGSFAEWQALLADTRWYDLPDPWIDSA